MSIKELLEFIKEELKNCPGNVFIDRTLNSLREEMEKREFFEPEKFKEWFIEKNVIYKNSPLAFLSKCGKEDIENGAFDKETISTFPLHALAEQFKAKEIEYDNQSDTLTRLEIYLVYIYNRGLMNANEIHAWLSKAVQYLEVHSKNAADIKDLLSKSKSMQKLHLPYKELEEEVTKEHAEWKKLIQEFDENENIQVNGNSLESETYYEKEIN